MVNAMLPAHSSSYETLTEAFKPLADKRGLYVPNGGTQTRSADNVIRLAAAKA